MPSRVGCCVTGIEIHLAGCSHVDAVASAHLCSCIKHDVSKDAQRKRTSSSTSADLEGLAAWTNDKQERCAPSSTHGCIISIQWTRHDLDMDLDLLVAPAGYSVLQFLNKQ